MWSAAAGIVAAPVVLEAEVVRVVVDRREDVLGGQPFGTVGAYEKLVGRIFFAFDPDSPANAAIVDLALAPRNSDGRVEAFAEFMVLQAKDPSSRRGVAWLEVSNRGGKASLSYFNRAPRRSNDPTESDEFGDGLFMREGITVVWVGWQWDVPEVEGLVRLHVPMVRPEGDPITGLVRSDWTVDEDVQVLSLSHRGHRAYPAVDPASDQNVLTVRSDREGPREVIPRERWTLLAPSEGPETGRLTHIALEGGFRAGHIYEFVYVSQEPRVAGLGLAAVRDVASYIKYALGSEFPAERVVAFGVSQTGRFLRHYLYQGFNTDEDGRMSVDGMLVHTAGGGRGSFNHRFAQPSRDAHPYSAFFYPTDIFPFTSRTLTDDVSGWEDGLMARTREDHRPKVFFTNTGYEYWGRAASLIHTTPDGARDVSPLETERIYHLAGGQHFVGAFPPDESTRMGDADVFRGDPLDFLVVLRALAVDLVQWVDSDRPPPASRYPTIADGTLVDPSGVAWPAVRGVEEPTGIHVAYRAEYGPRFRTEGIIDLEPPALGPPFPSRVSQVDGLGNEAAGVRTVELRVPLGTYLPWNLRTGYTGGETALTDFLGTWVPLAPDRAARRDHGDPRPSVAELYSSKAEYLSRVRQASAAMVADGFLLAEDVPRVVARAEEMWEWVTGRGSD